MDQCALGACDRALDGVQLLGKVKAWAGLLNHAYD
jgi:hypothetical protein